MVMQRKSGECARIAGGILLLAAMLGGCALQSDQPSRSIAPLQGHDIPPVEIPEFDELTPAMQAFLDRWVVSDRGPDRHAWSLVWAATDRNILDFRYDPAVTLPPAETFRRRTGNCLAFSLMFVALARHAGLNAWYQEVEVPPQWNTTNHTLLVSMHINVVVQGRSGAWVVDVSGRASARTRRLRRVSDEEAQAQFLNNLGADALTRDDLDYAYAYFAAAIRRAPQVSFVWSNLGVVYNRNGQTDEARRAHRTALQIDPGNSVAANNLFLIYEQEGDLAAAQALRAQVEKHRRHNPYYLYHLSSDALAAGRITESRELLEQAIELQSREYRFHYELARTLVRAGDMGGARASLRRARELAPDDALAGDLSVDNLPALPD
ncbi:tetratricopeptide repeat protein [Elongatibacter sediminis]|uniref:Tetratricopeptide repeat protein n=1 Tax=Elongatibacter sediminis TaxID=3119006 RepID=A0AAW9RE95_9GAMM